MPLKSKTRVQHSPLETVNVKAAEASAFPNTRSTLLELPLELIMEIISHFDCLPLITSKLNYYHFSDDPRVSGWYLERTNALRALSQTCRSWRNLFFPLLWERLEPCLIHFGLDKRSERKADLLMRMSAFVCENPEIASHVRCVIRTLCGG
jgi:hypothetical protein